MIQVHSSKFLAMSCGRKHKSAGSKIAASWSPMQLKLSTNLSSEQNFTTGNANRQRTKLHYEIRQDEISLF